MAGAGSGSPQVVVVVRAWLRQSRDQSQCSVVSNVARRRVMKGSKTRNTRNTHRLRRGDTLRFAQLHHHGAMGWHTRGVAPSECSKVLVSPQIAHSGRRAIGPALDDVKLEGDGVGVFIAVEQRRCFASVSKRSGPHLTRSGWCSTRPSIHKTASNTQWVLCVWGHWDTTDEPQGAVGQPHCAHRKTGDSKHMEARAQALNTHLVDGDDFFVEENALHEGCPLAHVGRH